MKISNRAFTQTNRKYKFKKYIFPEGFKLIIDTREQQPFFKRLSALIPEYFKLDTVKDGDYTIKGFENSFAIERKKMSDFYSYISSERSIQYKNNKKKRDKTKEKLLRLQKFDFTALVVNEDYNEVLSRQMFTDTSPEVARGFLSSINIKYGIHVFINSDAIMCERWILDRAIKFYNLKRVVG